MNENCDGTFRLKGKLIAPVHKMLLSFEVTVKPTLLFQMKIVELESGREKKITARAAEIKKHSS